MIEKVYEQKYQYMKNSLLYGMDAFDPKTEFNANIDAESRVILEDRFLEDCYQMLEKANFNALSKRELDFAMSEDYLNTLPIDIQWEKLDGELFQRFFEKVGTPNDSKAFDGKIWLYYRGIGVDNTTDMFTFQKLDLLIINIIAFIVGIPQKFLDLFSYETNASFKNRETNGLVNTVERITLRDALSFKKAGLKGIFGSVTLQEPTFKEVVVMYRKKDILNSTDITDAGATYKNNHSIFIKMFRDIPMADLEIIFPEKFVALRPLDFILFAITGIVGIISALLKFTEDGDDFLALTCFFGFVMLALKSFSDYKMNMYYYQSVMLGSLYDKCLDNQHGVILYLMEQLKAQEVKEVILLYYFMVHKGASTENTLDLLIEDFLLMVGNTLDEEIVIDFEVDDALNKLVELGLAHSLHSIDGELLYEAVSPNTAKIKLSTWWSSNFY
eukprot:TRINITY_DN5891_c0_g1_i2.p1 TRINITY_DN5891_c0_g1~~TRINITY_DN5891_c0_g1_i2.p1  ORF type:complete len:443 (+),score=90.28 TRINITY_DN5891_c0_g1_i2:420-1748(+)